MAGEKLERIYTVPLGKAYEYLRTRRTRRAVKLLRGFLVRHMKADDANVRISTALNEYLWARSIQKPPRRVKIRAVKEGETVRAWLADEKPEEKKEKKAEAKAEAKEAKPAQPQAKEAKAQAGPGAKSPDAKAQKPAVAEKKGAPAAAPKPPQASKGGSA